MEEGGYFTVGTICHEFFHSLGAPDLYHYDGNGAPAAMGGWDIMDGAGDPPAYMSAFMKYKYGDWIVYEPEINKNTILLWVIPLILFVFGGILIIRKVSIK